MVKYLIKRIALLIVALFAIMTIAFVLIRALPTSPPEGANAKESEAILELWEKRGYNEPLPVQYAIYLRGIFTELDFGTSWKIKTAAPASELLGDRLLPTVLVNLYSFIVAVPLGIALGILAAIKKNKWQDHLVSTLVMLFVSVPSYIYAFLVQYFLFFRLGLFPPTVLSLADAGGSWFSFSMLRSMIPPIIALSLGEIAGLCRFMRAELGETLSADYMLLAKAKGLSPTRATLRHALKNAMVPVFPMIISGFIGILGGSMIIEEIFSIPGVGRLYVQAVRLRDYDVFMAESIFYTFISLLAGIAVDFSYGLIDPRIRMGEK